MTDNVYVNNYDDRNDMFSGAFFLAIKVPINNFTNFYYAYKYCSKRCKDIFRITENRLNGIGWDNNLKVMRNYFVICT